MITSQPVVSASYQVRTGEAILDRYGLVAVFGDTFENAGVGGPGWRSPVVLFGDPATARTGIVWTVAAGPGD